MDAHQEELLECSLEQLVRLPSQLDSNHQALENELSLLCFKHFPSFIIANQTNTQIDHQLKQLTHSLHQFITTNQSLDARAKSFTQPNHPLNTILDDRNQIRSILDHLTTFENLIELPQLIATSINNQLEHQAIDLALKLKNLSCSSSSSSTTVHHQSISKSVKQHVNRSLQSLRDQLLNRLTHSNLNLPSAIRTINILRRLSTSFPPPSPPDQQHQISIQPIAEPELRLAFLTSRWQALSQSLRQLQLAASATLSISITNTNTTTIPTSLNLSQSQSDLLLNQHSSASQLDEDRLKFLRRWIELWRSFVGDTLSIYHDIFLSPPSSKSKQHSPPSEPSSQSLDDPQTPLNFFLSQALDLQTSFLHTHLDSILSVSSLSSLLTQLAYCAVAFGKWGIDFTVTVCPLIVSRLEQLVSLRIQLGLRQLSLDLKPIISPTPTSAHSLNHRNGGLQIRRRSLNPFSSSTHSTFVGLENSLISPDAINRVLKLKPTQLDARRSESFLSDWLSLFPPLVRFVNVQLTALNELRLLPVAGSYASLADAQFEALSAATDELRNLVHVLPESRTTHPEEHKPEDDEETEDQEKRSAYRLRLVTYRMLLLWTRNLLPTLERALRVDIYHQLDINSPQPRFLDLCDQAERLLTEIFPTHNHHHQQEQQKKPKDDLRDPLENQSKTDPPSSPERNDDDNDPKKPGHRLDSDEHPSVAPQLNGKDTSIPKEITSTLKHPAHQDSPVKASSEQVKPSSNNQPSSDNQPLSDNQPSSDNQPTFEKNLDDGQTTLDKPHSDHISSKT
jgi:hypothetical protein